MDARDSHPPLKPTHGGPTDGDPVDLALLDRVRFVLVETSLSANIGAVARAMKTMGLSRLVLVRPQQPLNAEALARAAGADDLLEKAEVCSSLDEALRGCELVIGSSARARSLAWPELDPSACAEQLLGDAARAEVALLLGRERSGLSNDELARCHFLTRIPANPDYSSLNIAAAAQLFAYELRRRALAGRPTPPALAEAREPLAAFEDMEGFYRHLEQTLAAIGFADPGQSQTLHRRLRRLFNRARPDRIEVNILRGILSAAQRARRPSDPETDRASDQSSR
jgi:tRNA (cytidine32/uridine32-2'-O)-methyltransferase